MDYLFDSNTDHLGCISECTENTEKFMEEYKKCEMETDPEAACECWTMDEIKSLNEKVSSCSCE